MTTTPHRIHALATPTDPDPASLLALACDADEHLVRCGMGIPLDHSWRARVLIDPAGGVHLSHRVLGRPR